MATPNLNLPDVLAGQDQKEVTINDQALRIDQAVGDSHSILVDNGNAGSITTDELREHYFFTVDDDTPAPTAAITVTIPGATSRGNVAFINNTGFDAEVTISGQPVTAPIVGPGEMKIVTVGGANVRGPAAGASLTTQEDDVNVTTDVTELNFEGAGVTVTDEGSGKSTVTIPGGGGGGGAAAAGASIISQQFRGALVQKSGNQAITTSTLTAITFDQELRDTDAIHDNVTNNTRLTVPNGVTKVRMTGNAQIVASATGNERTLRISKNGAVFAGFPEEVSEPKAATNSIGVVSETLDVVAGDYFELEVFQDSGGNLDLLSADQTWFGMEIVETIETVNNLQAVAVGTRPRYGGAVATITGSEAVGPGVTAIAWDQALIDTDGIWSAGTPTRLTVPAGVALIRLSGGGIWDDTTNARFLRMTKNGTAETIVPRADNNDNRAGDTLVSQVLSVVDGDYFELEASSDIATNLITTSYFEMEIVERVGATDFPTGFIAVQPQQKGALVRLDADKAANTGDNQTTAWDSADYDTAFDPGDGGLPQRFWLGPDLVVTFTNATNTVNATAHGMVTGEGPIELSNAGGGPPTGLAVATPYWWISTCVNSGQLATSRANAIAGTAVTFTTDGTGTTTMDRDDRLVVPAAVNKVRVSMNAHTATSTGRVLMELQKNGSRNFAGNPSQVVDSTAGNERVNMASPDLEVVEGDVFLVNNFVDSAVDLDGDTGRTWASIVVVEEARALSFPGVTVERPYIGARVHPTLATNQTLTDAVAAAITLDQEDTDTGYRGSQFHDNVTNNSRITIPVGVTKVRLSGAVGFAGNATGARDVSVRLNGSEMAPITATRLNSPTASTAFIQVKTGTIEVTPGDYFELFALQTSGGNLDTDSDFTWLDMVVEETDAAAFPPEQAEHFENGTPTASDRFFSKVAVRRFSLNDDLSGSQAHAVTAPSGGAVAFDVQRNEASIGTVTFADASNTAPFVNAGAGQVDFAVGDRLSIVAPANLQSMADVAFNLFAFRS